MMYWHIGERINCNVLGNERAEFGDCDTIGDEIVMVPFFDHKALYFLEFAGLNGMYSEKDLEGNLVAHLEQFIIELGNGFCFVERQKRMIIDGEDFYLAQ